MHGGTPIVLHNGIHVYVMCPRRHIIERVDASEWPYHWMHDVVHSSRFNVDCDRDENKQKETECDE